MAGGGGGGAVVTALRQPTNHTTALKQASRQLEASRRSLIMYDHVPELQHVRRIDVSQPGTSQPTAAAERASCVVIVSSDSVNQTLSADWPLLR